MEEDANKDTQKQIEEIKKIGKEKGSKVVDDLLNAVTNIKPVPPTKS
jgi:V-type H+-transporting ATPase subunit G